MPLATLAGAATLAAVLSVALPLAAALVAVPAGRWAPVLAAASAAAMLALAVVVALGAGASGPLAIPIGGWAPPLGIALALDGLAAVFVVATALVMGAALLFARADFAPRGPGSGRAETRASFAFWPLAFLLWGALNAVFLSGDLFNLYVALELLTLAAVALVALEGRRETIAAAIRYALFALAGSLLYLLGAVLLYAAHGTLDIALLAERTDGGTPDLAAAGLMTAGLAAKTALFPFHAWLPPAHSGAPASASAMLSGLVPKASFFIALRLWFDVMPGTGGAVPALALGALGAAAILYGSVLATAQQRLKLVVAYSTVAQIGYLFLVFPLAGAAEAPQPWSAGAWTGGVFHAVSHAAAKAAMFLAAGLFLRAVGHDRIDGLTGIARAMPMTAFAFGLAAVTLMGLPPSGGFTAKYLMLTAAFAGGGVAWAVPILAGGLLAGLYLFRPLARMFDRGGGAANLTPVPRWLQAIPLALALAAILLGLASAEPYGLMQVGRPPAAEEGLE
jgi:multicomponent Na+:H+ antiporter subunit D